MLTVKHAADRLGVSPSLVYALCGAGRIRHSRHGLGRGCIRISEEALEEYRRASQVEAGALPPPRLRHISLPPPSERHPSCAPPAGRGGRNGG
jgi:excisionase family DNA binding protein